MRQVRKQFSPHFSTGVVLKSIADRPKRLGFFVILLSGTLLGQVPASNQANHETQAATAATLPTQPPTASGNNLDDSSFIIGNDDVLAINVWKEPDLSRSTQVRSDGKISLPLVGEIHAAGRTPVQLEGDITTKLLNYIAKPEVTVMVSQINSKKFNIVGQVIRPGSYSLALAPTVMDAIATAGGLRDFAKQKTIYILRQNSGGGESRIAFNYKDFIKGKNVSQNIKLEPHDTVVVP
jgi:polysaccharide export outer membrane protein